MTRIGLPVFCQHAKKKRLLANLDRKHLRCHRFLPQRPPASADLGPSPRRGLPFAAA
jgi:hypothetical protein